MAEHSHTNRIVLEAAREILVEGIAQIDAVLAGDTNDAAIATLPAPADRTAFARAAGFTGDICRTCSGTSMFRAGSCLTCRDCGSTTGCS